MRKRLCEPVDPVDPEALVEIIDPASGMVIPTVRWVAVELIGRGWKVAEQNGSVYDNNETKEI